MSLNKEAVEPLDQSAPHLKSMDSANTSKNTLCKGICLCMVFENFCLVASLNKGCYSHNDDGERGDTADDQRELPVGDEGNDERADKGRSTLYSQTKLF